MVTLLRRQATLFGINKNSKRIIHTYDVKRITNIVQMVEGGK